MRRSVPSWAQGGTPARRLALWPGAREQGEQPIFRRRQGAVLVHGKLAGGPGLPIEAPRGHMRVKRGLKGRNQLLKLVEGQAGQIQELRGTGLHIGEL